MRRSALGLSDTYVASEAGVSIDEYWDLERDTDEIYMTTPLGKLARVGAALSLGFEEILQLPTCRRILRVDSIRTRREDLGLSLSALSDQVGIEEASLAAAETDPTKLQEWVLDPILALSHVLSLPLECVLELATRHS